MRKICIILLLNSLLAHSTLSQTLIQQIENAYNSIDSISYIEDIILSFINEIEKEQNEIDNTTLELYGFDYTSIDSIQKKNILDSIDSVNKYSIHYRDVKFLSIEERINIFSARVREETPLYVLNLIPKNEHTLQVDTGKLSFNLFYFDKEYKGSLYVYCKNGKYSWQDTRYRSFSDKLGENAPEAFRKIMEKRPKYLLYCSELEEMNTILYVLKNNLFIYRITQMKEYELRDYIKEFGIVK